MKSEFQQLARRNGAQARIKAARVLVILRLQTTKPVNSKWLQMEATRLARAVAFHLRQAAVIDSMITRIESRDPASKNAGRLVSRVHPGDITRKNEAP